MRAVDDDGDRIFGKLSFLDLKTKIDKGCGSKSEYF